MVEAAVRLPPPLPLGSLSMGIRDCGGSRRPPRLRPACRIPEASAPWSDECRESNPTGGTGSTGAYCSATKGGRINRGAPAPPVRASRPLPGDLAVTLRRSRPARVTQGMPGTTPRPRRARRARNPRSRDTGLPLPPTSRASRPSSILRASRSHRIWYGDDRDEQASRRGAAPSRGKHPGATPAARRGYTEPGKPSRVPGPRVSDSTARLLATRLASPPDSPRPTSPPGT
jgi:hypothetical protein